MGWFRISTWIFCHSVARLSAWRWAKILELLQVLVFGQLVLSVVCLLIEVLYLCCQTKMATAPSIPEQVKEIAQAAIDSINQLSSLIEHGTSTTRFSSNKHQLTTSETTFVHQTQPANSALTELQRRFPTVSRGRYRRPSTSSSQLYPVLQNVRRPAGRPLASEIVSKDVMILEMGREKIPTKADLFLQCFDVINMFLTSSEVSWGLKGRTKLCHYNKNCFLIHRSGADILGNKFTSFSP